MKPRLVILLCQLATALAFSASSTSLPWSFKPFAEIPLPDIQHKDWPQTRLDHFVLAGIEAKGLRPAEPARDRELLRRLYSDLIGLPPSPDELIAFQRDAARHRASAIRRVIDTLLASPHYGERWARHWLDLARYTDKTASWLNSTGEAWRYRDWIVQALNQDLPYDEFVKQQLANDLLPASNPKNNAALGFLGLSPTYWKELQLPPEIIKTTVADEWEERMDAVGRTFLGLTLACARCHDHKFEPVTQADYYAIAGVFASVRIADRPTMSEEIWTPVKEARANVGRLEKEMEALKKSKPADLDAKLSKLQAKIQGIKSSTPHYSLPMVNGIEDAALYVNQATERHGTRLDFKVGEARNLAIHLRGNPNVTGETIPRRFLGAFPRSANEPRRFDRGSGRLDLAESIVDEASPLTARVIVNRVWQHHVGRGLVPTPSELGHSGEAPSHPALLNDLAAQFIESGWSVKWLHREILRSATWQQSIRNPEAQALDPNNRSLARISRRRLEAETWRDTILYTSGTLDSRVGGAPQELEAATNIRRTLYSTIHRREPNAFLRLHDFPDPTAHAPTRTQTITPLQQLYSLNAPFLRQQAEALAIDLGQWSEQTRRVRMAHQRLFQRDPRPRELEIINAFLSEQSDESLAWHQYLHALYVGNEFQYID